MHVFERHACMQHTCDHASGMLPRICTVADSSPEPVSMICSVSTKLATLPPASAPRRQWRVPHRRTARRAMRVIVMVSFLTPACSGASLICLAKPRMQGTMYRWASASARAPPSGEGLTTPPHISMRYVTHIEFSTRRSHVLFAVCGRRCSRNFRAIRAVNCVLVTTMLEGRHPASICERQDEEGCGCGRGACEVG